MQRPGTTFDRKQPFASIVNVSDWILVLLNRRRNSGNGCVWYSTYSGRRSGFLRNHCITWTIGYQLDMYSHVSEVEAAHDSASSHLKGSTDFGALLTDVGYAGNLVVQRRLCSDGLRDHDLPNIATPLEY